MRCVAQKYGGEKLKRILHAHQRESSSSASLGFFCSIFCVPGLPQGRVDLVFLAPNIHDFRFHLFGWGEYFDKESRRICQYQGPWNHDDYCNNSRLFRLVRHLFEQRAFR